MDTALVKLIEVVMVVAGVLAFGVWQLRSVDRDRRARLAREDAEREAAEREAAGRRAGAPAGPPGDSD